MTGSCSDDSQCSAPTPRCNLNVHACVPCLPEHDNCPAGQRCVLTQGSFACTLACVADVDCGGSPGQRCCAGKCADTSSDTANCGSCGTACVAPPHASAICERGMCALGKCDAGFLDCDHGAANGCEVNAVSDDRNCGACGTVCSASANQGVTCTMGACVTSCNAGFANCDLKPGNGCEVNTRSDAAHCGACGAACQVVNGSAACRAGACAIDACSAGFDDCNGQVMDGCETDLQRDLAHCGDCANACAGRNGVPSCQKGVCGIASCNPGFADCNRLLVDGCEAATQSDARNCGACGARCAGAFSVQACQMGACVVTECTPGYADCDRKAASGCEVNVSVDSMNCGACGKVCPTPTNATAACTSGACGIGQCKPNFSDCNQDPVDGCETDLLTLQNCGRCGRKCAAPANATAACNNGVCGIGVCNNPFGDCDSNAGNGCETDLSGSLLHCGGCGKPCGPSNAQPACVNGQCAVLACNPGFGNCDGMAANGCEVDLANDAQNCGACKNACPMNLPTCTAGKCQLIGKSCQDLLLAGINVSGQYVIDPDGPGPVLPFNAWCDMTTAGGGWLLLVNRVTMSDDLGQGDLATRSGMNDNARAANFTISVLPLYAGIKDIVYAVKHNSNCPNCTILQYDSAIQVARSAPGYTVSCPGPESVQGTKLVGPGAGMKYTVWRCAGALGWGKCGNYVCHWGVNTSSNNGDDDWGNNLQGELHFPSAWSQWAYRLPFCRSCGGGLDPKLFNPLTSPCCDINQYMVTDKSTWTVWVR